ncbi:MAG: metallophosphoesterase family protein [Bacteroidota bacterium]
MSTQEKKVGNKYLSGHSSIGKEIPLPKGTRWVIGDIHGCIKTLKSLLERINLKPEDQLFLLGDYINKGPSSFEVLMEVIDMKGSVYPLIGNHDKMLLDYYLQPTDELKNTLIRLNSRKFVDTDNQTRQLISNFLGGLPYYYLSGNYILVHAGFNFELEEVFNDPASMITIKDFGYDTKKVSAKTIIHGHNPKPLNVIQESINQAEKVLPLDNGCVYEGMMEGVGNLIGLNINRMKILIQPNID